MHGTSITPTQRAAHERSRAFRNHIDTLALKLKVGIEAPVPKVVQEQMPKPAAQESTLAIKQPWFSIVKETGFEPRGYPSIDRIQLVICEHFGLSRNDLRSACRERRIAYPRQIAMYLCRELTPKSLPDIARRFGKRDHSTAHHAYHKIRNKITSDVAFAAEISKLKEMLA